MAFGTNALTLVQLTESVVEITDAAFAYGSIKTIEIPSNSKLFSLDKQGALYDFMKTRIIWVPIVKNFHIPLTVQSIPNHLFANSEITEIVIPPICSSIGNMCFINCANLARITITGNIKSIHENFISDCPLLSDVFYHGTTKIDKININNNVQVYTCIEFKWEQTFGKKSEKNGHCLEMNIISIPTCNSYSLYIIGKYAIFCPIILRYLFLIIT